MGWYGDTIPDEMDGDINRHWKYGHANLPQAGLYDSKNRALLTYHLLLSWSCGIDGIIINLKDAYDDLCMRRLISTIRWLRTIDSVNFNYDFGISYDDQGFDLAPPFDTTIRKMSYLRDSIIPGLPEYIKYNDRPALFVFDYPEKYITAKNFSSVLREVFGSTPPIVIWNSLDDKENSREYVDAFYPWVQPGNKGWDKAGANWGKEYLDWYYPRVNAINSNNGICLPVGVYGRGLTTERIHHGEENRLMARRNGQVYDSTWSCILRYNLPLPLPWVVIETWNDWNEGTEIEPSLEYGNQYLLSTIKNINAFKGTSVDLNEVKFEAAMKIYELYLAIESGMSEYYKCVPALRQAIGEYLRKEFDRSLQTACNDIKKIQKNRISIYKESLLSPI
jgi:hypothetical protein